MTAQDRAQRTVDADALCAKAYEAAGGGEVGCALIAVGGYGRAELAPHSDLDVVLVHDEDVDPGEVAAQVWYPLWDSGLTIDHSVRRLDEMVAAADADLKVALGLVDIRHLAGDPNLTLRLRTTMLAHWRQQARERLPALRELVRARHELMGELAHRSVPDLKESEGGLRDATVLKALTATWLVDVPHIELEQSRQALLDVRDLVQGAAGRSTDRINPEMWSELATGLGLPDARSAQVHVRTLGRRITHLSRLTWRRVEDYLKRPVSARTARRPQLVPVAPGVALSRQEIVLDAKARPSEDPVLLLRAAAAASELDVVLAPPTAARLARETPPMPDPWPTEARQHLVRMLAGKGLLHVWETLLEQGEDLGCAPFGVEAQRILRLEKGHYIVGQDTDGLSKAPTAGLGGLVKLDKPDTIGLPELRAAYERDDLPILVGLQTDDPTIVPTEASQIVDGDTNTILGRITSSRMSPNLGRSVCLAQVHPSLAAAGTSVTVLLADGRRVTATVQEHHAHLDPEGARQRV